MRRRKTVSEITWGDTVRVSENAPSEFRPGEFGAVCGWNESNIPVIYFTVEFGDGVTLEIPNAFVSKVDI
jgi:hypothetical protein